MASLHSNLQPLATHTYKQHKHKYTHSHRQVMEYGGPPVSAYQAKMRGGATHLLDHICKDMDPVNLQRCRCVCSNQ